MKKKILTNEKICKVPTFELVFRMNCLHVECKRRGEDAGIPITNIWEANSIVKELKRRLGRLGIFYLEVKNER